MQDVSGALDVAIDAAGKLKAALRKRTHRQVRSSDERMLVKATSQAWFRSYKPSVMSLSAEPLFRQVDTAFATLLEYSDQSTGRSKYLELLTTLRSNLVQLRSRGVLASPGQVAEQPDFPKLITDAVMLGILERRWKETLSSREPPFRFKARLYGDLCTQGQVWEGSAAKGLGPQGFFGCRQRTWLDSSVGKRCRCCAPRLQKLRSSRKRTFSRDFNQQRRFQNVLVCSFKSILPNHC